MDDNDLYMSDDEIEEFEQYYYDKFGKYDLRDFQDLIRWAREFEPKNPERMDEVERMGICIRILSTEKMGNHVAYKFMSMLCEKITERAEKAEAENALLRDELAIAKAGKEWREFTESKMDELARLRAALEAVEFVIPFRNHGNEYKHLATCPWCGALNGVGHAPDCQRQQALEVAP